MSRACSSPCAGRAGLEAPDRAGEHAEPFAALVALVEQKLHADADAEHGPAGRGARADRLVDAGCREPTRRARDVTDAGDDRQRRLAHAVASSVTNGSAPARVKAEAEAAQVPGAVVRDGDLHGRHALWSGMRIALRRPEPATAPRAGFAQRTAEGLERRLRDVVVVLARRLDVHRAARLDREPLERVREQRQREPADAVAAERERDLGVRRRTRSTAAVARASSIGTVAEP